MQDKNRFSKIIGRYLRPLASSVVVGCLVTILAGLAFLLIAAYCIKQFPKINTLQGDVNDLENEIKCLEYYSTNCHSTVKKVTTTPQELIGLKKDRILLAKDIFTIQDATYVNLYKGFGAAIFFVSVFLGLKNTAGKQIPERYTKAVELLGDEKQIVRIGGIHELDRIAKDHKEYHQLIMLLLTSFIREKSPLLGESNSKLQKISLDVQTALTTLARRNSINDKEERLDLSFTFLRGADFRGTDRREAFFNQASFKGSNLSEAYFSEAHLTEANFSGANL